LEKAYIVIRAKEFAVGLTFVALSRVQALNDLCLKQFNFDRLQHIKMVKDSIKEKIKKKGCIQ
jgi:hypothetical protein